MKKGKEVWIFYSSQTEPDLIRFYSEGITYLHESKIKTHVVDIYENPKIARKHKVIATPIIIVKKGKEVKRYLGIVDGLKKLLTSDLYGLSVLHTIGFKEGRTFARKLKLSEKDGEIGEVLNQSLSSKGIISFRLMEFNPNSVYARVSLVYDPAKEYGKDKIPLLSEISAFLGGVFTEIFGVGVIAKDKQYFDEGDNYCEFEIMEAEHGKEDVSQMVRAAIK